MCVLIEGSYVGRRVRKLIGRITGSLEFSLPGELLIEKLSGSPVRRELIGG